MRNGRCKLLIWINQFLHNIVRILRMRCSVGKKSIRSWSRLKPWSGVNLSACIVIISQTIIEDSPVNARNALEMIARYPRPFNFVIAHTPTMSICGPHVDVKFPFPKLKQRNLVCHIHWSEVLNVYEGQKGAFKWQDENSLVTLHVFHFDGVRAWFYRAMKQNLTIYLSICNTRSPHKAFRLLAATKASSSVTIWTPTRKTTPTTTSLCLHRVCWHFLSPTSRVYITKAFLPITPDQINLTAGVWKFIEM